MDNKTKQSIRFHTMAILLIIIFCISITPKTLQNDTFYTIKIGDYILEKGITMQDPFSWHQNLKYTFPHWAYDVFIYIIYSIGGITGIYISTIVLAAILGILIYFTNVKLVKNKIFSFIITILGLYLMKPYICARAQLATFILFILTIYFIEQFLETKKIRYAVGLVIIPILIANLHLATFYFYFILYLPYLAEFVIYILSYSTVIISKSSVIGIKKTIEKHGETPELLEKLTKAETKYNRLKTKEDERVERPYKIKINYNPNVKWLVIIFIICLFTGLLTPLKDTPYTYLINTMKGISTQNISEHLPIVLANNIKILIVFAVYIVIISFTNVKIKLSDLFMLGGLMVLTILSRRQASMLILVGTIIINRLITSLLLNKPKEWLTKIEDKSTHIIALIGISVIVIGVSIYQYNKIKDDNYIDETSYPVTAAEWIKENLDLEEIKLYNEYNYGSYLLYKDIPVFVDSRCDLYMPEFNENVYVFRDFLNINNLGITGIEKKLDEYGITHLITTNTSKIKLYMDLLPETYIKIYPTEDINDKYFSIYERIVK